MIELNVLFVDFLLVYVGIRSGAGNLYRPTIEIIKNEFK